MSTSEPANSVTRGAMLTIAMRWANRLVSIVSTLILARLLTPDDFGIVALAFMVLAFIQVFLEFGVNLQLVQNTEATDAHFHSAWTLQVMQACAVAVLLAAGAEAAAAYFKDPRLTPVLWVLAVNVAIGGLQNIGIVKFQKNMQFGLEFRFLVINRVVSFVFVVAGAWLLRSYWAMIIAGTLGGIFGVVHSYVAHPMRPRWDTSKLRELFSVSQWLLLRNIGQYADANLHKLLVGRRTDTATMGGYALASDVAGMPSTELLQPINRALFPAFARAKHDLAQLRRMFLLAQGIQVLVAVPAGVGVAVMADEIVRVFFGEKWMAAVPFLQVLAVASVIEAIGTSAGYVNITLGRFRQATAVIWSQVLLFVALSWLLLPGSGAVAIAEFRVGALLIGLALQFGFVMQAVPGLTLGSMAAGIWRPLTSSAVLALATIQLQTTLGASAPTLLLLKTALWGLGYPALGMLLWWACGRPEGAEAYLVAKLRGVSKRWSKPAA